MTLPQQVVERVSREMPRTPGWSGQLLAFSAAIFIIMAALYGGITYGYEPYANSQISNLNTQIKQYGDQVPIADQAKIATFYSQLINLKNILDTHTPLSPLFTWLETNTDKNVAFTNAAFDTVKTQMVLTGTAKTADDASLQARIFENDPMVANTVLSSLAAGPTGWQFTLTLTFNAQSLQSLSALVPASTTSQTPLPIPTTTSTTP